VWSKWWVVLVLLVCILVSTLYLVENERGRARSSDNAVWGWAHATILVCIGLSIWSALNDHDAVNQLQIIAGVLLLVAMGREFVEDTMASKRERRPVGTGTLVTYLMLVLLMFFRFLQGVRGAVATRPNPPVASALVWYNLRSRLNLNATPQNTTPMDANFPLFSYYVIDTLRDIFSLKEEILITEATFDKLHEAFVEASQTIQKDLKSIIHGYMNSDACINSVKTLLQQDQTRRQFSKLLSTVIDALHMKRQGPGGAISLRAPKVPSR
jgi:hypothetical protein